MLFQFSFLYMVVSRKGKNNNNKLNIWAWDGPWTNCKLDQLILGLGISSAFLLLTAKTFGPGMEDSPNENEIGPFVIGP